MKYLATLLSIASFATGATALAEPLASIWRLEPTTVLPTEATFGQPFLEQRLLPFRLARLTTDAAGAKSGALLFLVYNAKGQIAYCTFKDSSARNVAKSLFIPALDKRPCFIDNNSDGHFDATFSVFDKYGSLATPSGDISQAKPMPYPASYAIVTSNLAAERRIVFSLTGKRTSKDFDIDVRIDKRGNGKMEQLVGNPFRSGTSL